MEELRNTFDMLRKDALNHGMLELAAAYGWAEIRIGNEILQRQMRSLTPEQDRGLRHQSPGGT